MSSLKDIRIFLEQAAHELYAEPTVDDSGAVRRAIDSTDDQIDSFIIKFERDSIVAEEDLISESLKDLSLSALLEQDEDQDEPAAEDNEDDAKEDREDSPPVGSVEVTVDGVSILCIDGWPMSSTALSYAKIHIFTTHFFALCQC